MALCLEFQKDIDKGNGNVLRALLSEKDCLQNEMHVLGEKNNALKNSMMAFIEGILEDLNSGNSGKFILLMFANSKIHFLILEFNTSFVRTSRLSMFCLKLRRLL